MPPKRSQTRKRATRNTDEGPLAQRSRRQSTRNATLASQATAQVRTEDQTSAVPPSNVPSTTIQRLDPDLVKSLVSTVAEEVNRQITATLPALASPLGHHMPSVAPRVPELNGENHLSATSLHGVSAETLVEGAIATAHTQIAGAPHILPTNIITQARSQPSQTFLSAGLPIDSQISIKLKEKIWNEEFVDFGALLSNPGQDKYQISLQNSEAGTPASFCLEPVSRPKKITSIEVWQQAFYIFAGVYTQKHPHEAPALMKYGQTIRDLAARGQNWRFYDENFRFLRGTQASLVPWGSIHGELWLRSQFPANKALPSSSQVNGIAKSGVPSGYCFKFHRGQFCSAVNCVFNHTCFKCKKGTHSARKCNFRGSTGKTPANSDRPAKSPNAGQATTSR